MIRESRSNCYKALCLRWPRASENTPTPSAPLGSETVPTVTPALTVRVSDWGCETAPKLSFTVTLKVELPVVLGVPVIAPVEEFKVRPAGKISVVIVQVL